jgi:hypothetical protein
MQQKIHVYVPAFKFKKPLVLGLLGKHKARALQQTYLNKEGHAAYFSGAPGVARTRHHWIRRLLHHFYDPFPTVEHHELIQNYPATLG